MMWRTSLPGMGGARETAVDLDHPAAGAYLLGRILAAALQNGDITEAEMASLANELLGNS